MYPLGHIIRTQKHKRAEKDPIVQKEVINMTELQRDLEEFKKYRDKITDPRDLSFLSDLLAMAYLYSEQKKGGGTHERTD